MESDDILLWRDGFWCFRNELDPRSWRNDHYRQIRCASLEAKKMIFARPTLRVPEVQTAGEDHLRRA
jgi:hypothetical protein